MFVARLWGRHSLAPIFPFFSADSTLREPIGEVWLTDHECGIATGPFTKKHFDQVWREAPPEWRGTRLRGTRSFPLLLKFIFPNDKLSIQVHPDDTYAAAHEQAFGGVGKTEMWHVVSAEPGAQVLVGLKQGVDRKSLLDGLEQNELENLLEVVPVNPGDTLFVPAGTPHTIGPDMVICEIQQFSDLTYRLYDYGRVDARGKSRELHVKKAMDVIKFESREGGKVAPLSLPTENAKRSLLAACRYFATERWECSERCVINVDPMRFEVLVILDGDGKLAWGDNSADYHQGECWIVPASQGRVEILPEIPSVLVRSFMPDVDSLRVELLRMGVRNAALSQVIFG